MTKRSSRISDPLADKLRQAEERNLLFGAPSSKDVHGGVIYQRSVQGRAKHAAILGSRRAKHVYVISNIGSFAQCSKDGPTASLNRFYTASTRTRALLVWLGLG